MTVTTTTGCSHPCSCPSTNDKKTAFLDVPSRTMSYRTAKTQTLDASPKWTRRTRSPSPCDSDSWRTSFHTPSPTRSEAKAKVLGSPASDMRFRLVAAPSNSPRTAADWFQARLESTKVHSGSQSAASSLANSPMPSPRSRIRRSSDPTHTNWRISRKLQFGEVVYSDVPHAVRHPLGGMLRSKAVLFFCQAYGLDGHVRRDHDDIIKQAIEETSCSERAIHETLYGHSYSPLLQQYRDLIPGYTPKVNCRLRNTLMKELVPVIKDHDFYNFDGNKVSETETATTTEATTTTEA